MPTTRKSGRKTPARKTTGGITKAKVKRAARKAKASLDMAAHDTGLALRRTARQLLRTAQKLEAKFKDSKAPAKRRAQRVERKVLAALEGAGESLTAAASKAKSQLAAVRRSLAGATKRPVAKRKVAKRRTARRKAPA